MTLAAILFDLDNTLVDRDRALREVLVEALGAESGSIESRNTERLDAILARDASGDGDREAFGRWLEAQHPELVARLPESDGTSWDRLRVAMLARIRPEPGLRALLLELRRRYRLALVSNGGRATQRGKLEQAGLLDLFDAVLISAEQGCAKPGAEIFTRALDRLGVTADQALFVGDHPQHDVAGASAAGLQTCWIASGRRYPDGLPVPSFQVQQVRELPGVLS